MKTFKVTVREILEKTIEVKAKTEARAIDMVEEMYEDEQIVLDSGDYVDTAYNVFKFE